MYNCSGVHDLSTGVKIFRLLNKHFGWKITKHVLYILNYIFLTKKNNPCTSSCRLHSYQIFSGSKLQYQAVQSGITRVAILAVHFFSNFSMGVHYGKINTSPSREPFFFHHNQHHLISGIKSKTVSIKQKCYFETNVDNLHT